MNSIYIGDRQLEPDEEAECPHCGEIHACGFDMRDHIAHCPENDDIDYPDTDYGEPL